ncbi:hypothetical protein HYX00_02835 [Candidatus Woesearchaeota archaeon]|nr:hypothetical protein [Candidatus Woesearchaeota archaeon]
MEDNTNLIKKINKSLIFLIVIFFLIFIANAGLILFYNPSNFNYFIQDDARFYLLVIVSICLPLFFVSFILRNTNATKGTSFAKGFLAGGLVSGLVTIGNTKLFGCADWCLLEVFLISIGAIYFAIGLLIMIIVYFKSKNLRY